MHHFLDSDTSSGRRCANQYDTAAIPAAVHGDETVTPHPPAAAEPLQPNDLTDSRALNRARSRFGTAFTIHIPRHQWIAQSAWA